MKNNELISRALEYIKGIRDGYWTYHHHKERSAWTGAVFFSAAVIGFIPVVTNLNLGNHIAIQFAINIVAISFVVWLRKQALRYVEKQLYLRNWAANVVHAGHKILGQLVVGKLNLKPEDLQINNDEAIYGDVHGYPFLPSVLVKAVKPEENYQKKGKTGTARGQLQKLPRQIINIGTCLSVFGILQNPVTILVSSLF